MRANEFILNIRIKIDGEPEVTLSSGTTDDSDVPLSYVPPLQQKIELMKHAAGKQSEVINQITADDPDM